MAVYKPISEPIAEIVKAASLKEVQGLVTAMDIVLLKVAVS